MKSVLNLKIKLKILVTLELIPSFVNHDVCIRHDGIVPKRNKSETVWSIKGFIPKFLPQSGITPKGTIPKGCHTLE